VGVKILCDYSVAIASEKGWILGGSGVSDCNKHHGSMRNDGF
jgi:hypothetical protein